MLPRAYILGGGRGINNKHNVPHNSCTVVEVIKCLSQRQSRKGVSGLSGVPTVTYLGGHGKLLAFQQGFEEGKEKV